MSALDATALLAAWEAGVSKHPLQRALALLATAWPEKSADEWAAVSIGERDRRLLQLREELFGANLDAIAGCPQCPTRLELSLSTSELRAPAPQEPSRTEPFCLRVEDYELTYRLPTTADLLDVVEQAGQARDCLLERCIRAKRGDSEVPASTLPASLVELVGHRMVQADPQTEIEIALTCPGCSHRWTAVFEISAFLWGEIEDWAERLLMDVHSLARAYGWSERDILSMSARRRRLYLEMAGA
jgi:hypothetical protein